MGSIPYEPETERILTTLVAALRKPLTDQHGLRIEVIIRGDTYRASSIESKRLLGLVPYSSRERLFEVRANGLWARVVLHQPRYGLDLTHVLQASANVHQIVIKFVKQITPAHATVETFIPTIRLAR